jgi:solute:Na+ symporter, SSS family
LLIASIIIYLVLTLLIGFWASRKVKNTRDFTLAGRQMPLFVVASSLFATWFGSETIMGASSKLIDEGVLGLMEDPFGSALCLILVGAFFARPLYKLNILTFSDYYRIRFGKSAEIVSAVLMVPSYFTWISAQLIAMAVVLNVIAGLPIIWGITICTSAVVLYTFTGGMWAVSVTDTIQTVMIIFGLLAVMIILLMQVGGFQPLIDSQPKEFFNFLPKNTFKDWVHYVAAWMTIGLGSIPQQDIFQRVLSAKNERTAVVGSYASGFMYLTVALIPLVIVMAGKALHGSINEGDSQMAIPFLVLKHTDIWVQILFFGALLSAIMSTASGAILAPATVVGENLLKPLLGNQISDKTLLKAMRISVVGIALISAWLATSGNSISEMVAQSSALSLVSLFVPLVAGLYVPKANSVGAIASMLIGISSWIVFEFFIETDYPSLVIGLIFSVLAMVVGSFVRVKD